MFTAVEFDVIADPAVLIDDRVVDETAFTDPDIHDVVQIVGPDFLEVLVIIIAHQVGIENRRTITDAAPDTNDRMLDRRGIHDAAFSDDGFVYR